MALVPAMPNGIRLPHVSYRLLCETIMIFAYSLSYFNSYGLMSGPNYQNRVLVSMSQVNFPEE